MSIFTPARKITAARIAGATAAGGALAYLTKRVSVACPVVGVVVAGALLAHRKLAKADIEEVSVGGLCAAAAVSAAEVATGGAAAVAARKYFDSRGNRLDVKPAEAETVPAEAVDIVTG